MSNTWFRLRRGFFLSFFPSDTPHYPYLLPNGWEWCNLEDIVSFGGGKTPSMDNKEYWDNGNHLWVTSKDMKYSYITNSLMKITDKALEVMTIYEKGTLLVVTRSGILRHTLPLSILEKPATVNQDLKTISPHIQELSEYLYVVIKANEHFILKEYHKDGTTVDSIDFDKFRCLPIPLAPIAEQKRIIVETKRWFALIDQVEQGKVDLQTTIKQAKSKILGLAIHGKLVPQDLNDEPAIELLKRINPDFTPCDNGHYPVGWIETILGELFSHNTGKALNSSNKEGIFKDYLTTSNVYWNKFDFTAIKQMPFKESELNKCTVTKGDLLVCEGGDIGRSAIWNYDYDICIQNHIHRLRPKIDLCVPFYYYTFAYLKENNLIGGKGIGLLGLSSNALHKIEMPLPPLAEQQRIVQKIEELFSVLDNIQNALEV
ncbi:restriction endonuclease subunit S [Phocaeicola dorei]|jgi:type I restriction enzyme S subunit|uniref:Type I restriction modification DNA specificity domain-containing protein n=3 Tax=Phocaeicola dorei TaxID=357276 RepID=B6VTA2_9BACT|nr:restriction endonuclease subunit S [Phocaeicola dorei]EEB26959.1 type I restriction modification DNA specificity domain protein [Phocaeicola dorei DSM 17855]KAA5318975.1 restriction endonuclease subunit S [Phocaeicola dorei]KAA5355727.1 restriction endonuclease subunit S [Phocaeicola dorei]KAA5367774.1 restriction endonuclease subunit S [Phocaeicola dorei]MCB6792533.1 restriction endonuclease subunit S [Phocaeicola dorei]